MMRAASVTLSIGVVVAAALGLAAVQARSCGEEDARPPVDRGGAAFSISDCSAPAMLGPCGALAL